MPYLPIFGPGYPASLSRIRRPVQARLPAGSSPARQQVQARLSAGSSPARQQVQARLSAGSSPARQPVQAACRAGRVYGAFTRDLAATARAHYASPSHGIRLRRSLVLAKGAGWVTVYILKRLGLALV